MIDRQFALQVQQYIGVIFREQLFITVNFVYLNQAWYQHVAYIPLNACQIWTQSDNVFKFHGSMQKEEK